MQPQTDLEHRLRCALGDDASRAVGRYPDRRRIDLSRSPLSGLGPHPRLRLRAGLIATCALALAGAVFVSEAGRPRTALGATPPMLSFSSEGAPPISVLLTDLADRAAASPSVQPPHDGFVYLAQESWYLSIAVGKTVSATIVPTVTNVWTTATGPQLALTAPAPPMAAGLAERAKEQKQTLNGVTAGRPMVEHLSARELRPFASLSGLSSQPRTLFRQLAAPSNVGWPDSMADPVAVGHAMNSLQQYLAYSSPNPTFLSTIYRMLMLVPGVSDSGWVTDRAGRRGLAVAVPTGTPGYRHSFRLIIRPRDGRLLDIEDIQLDRSAVPVKPPFVYAYVVYLHSAPVRRLGDLP